MIGKTAPPPHRDGESLVEEVERRIRETAIAEALEPGDVLPSETDLAKRFGVSRSVVREALSHLRILGFLESRQRRGLVVREPDIFDGFERVLALPAMSDTSRRGLVRLRVVLELGLMDIVFANRTDEELDYLEAVVREEERNPKDWDLSKRCEVLFHGKLFEMARDPVLARFRELLEPFFAWNTREMLVPDRFENPDYVSHRDLLERLRRGPARSFRVLMRKHLEPYMRNGKDHS